MYEVIPHERLVSVKFGKSVTLRDLENYARALRSDPLFDPSFSEIVDLSEVEDLQVAAPQALALADKIDPFSQSARRAFVACSERQAHAARMHQRLRGGEENVRIFRTWAAAKEWVVRGTPAKGKAGLPARHTAARARR